MEFLLRLTIMLDIRSRYMLNHCFVPIVIPHFIISLCVPIANIKGARLYLIQLNDVVVTAFFQNLNFRRSTSSLTAVRLSSGIRIPDIRLLILWIITTLPVPLIGQENISPKFQQLI